MNPTSHATNLSHSSKTQTSGTLEDVVLVVDDAPDTLAFMNETLEAAGFSVLVALEGQQAITIAKKIRPAIILLDAVMPHMDGFETCEHLLAEPNLADIPVIFLTGLSDSESIVRGLAVGGADFLSKPINSDELLARIRVHLNRAKQTHAAQHALDSVGQLLFTCDANGQLLWATRRVSALFERAGLGQSWISTELQPQIQQWLSSKPGVDEELSLQHSSYPLALSLVDQRSGNEHLFKLIDGKQPTGAELLRLKLPLTERESEVLFWLANGKANREIGLIIDMSPRTVNKHLEQIYRKLEVDNRTSAAAKAIKVLTQP